ncbi:MAG: hypothetical protein QXV01_06120, partial [Candidatus Bathyarchaeia archaeon]
MEKLIFWVLGISLLVRSAGLADKFDLDLLFRAYDIRGVYGVHLTEVFAKVLGRALGDFLGCGSRVVVGRDV